MSNTTALEAWGDAFTAFQVMCENDTCPQTLTYIGFGLLLGAPTSVHRNEVLTLCARHRIRLDVL